MKSPFDIDAGAYEPFYTDTVSVRGQAQTISLRACVFEDTLDDPLSEMSPSAVRRRVSVFVPKSGEGGWNCGTGPKRGDILTIAPGAAEFAIETVNDILDSWALTAREV